MIIGKSNTSLEFIYVKCRGIERYQCRISRKKKYYIALGNPTRRVEWISILCDILCQGNIVIFAVPFSSDCFLTFFQMAIFFTSNTSLRATKWLKSLTLQKILFCHTWCAKVIDSPIRCRFRTMVKSKSSKSLEALTYMNLGLNEWNSMMGPSIIQTNQIETPVALWGILIF